MNHLELVRHHLRVEQKAPPQIEGHSHYWRLIPYERYISRGTCDCGAIWFFADTHEGKVFERINFLNIKKGKEGKIMERKDSPSPAEPAIDEPAASTISRLGLGEPAVSHPEPEVPPISYKNLPVEEKILIAEDAETIGLKKAGEKYGIRWQVIRAWVLTYCRRWRQKALSAGEPASPAPATGRTKLPSDTKVPKGNPPIIRESIDTKDLRVVLNIKLNLVPPGILIPDLPKFNDSWPEMVQLRWLDTYKALAGR